MAILITPENDIERALLESEEFQKSLAFVYTWPGRPENSLGEHVQHILGFIDEVGFDPKFREDLRFLALVHDFGKYLGKGHAQRSKNFASRFTNQQRILDMIERHDTHYSYYRRFKDSLLQNDFRRKRFIEIFSSIDLDTMVRFNYADLCEREKDSVIWFEDRCIDLGLRKEKVYETNPKVLINYRDF